MAANEPIRLVRVLGSTDLQEIDQNGLALVGCELVLVAPPEPPNVHATARALEHLADSGGIICILVANGQAPQALLSALGFPVPTSLVTWPANGTPWAFDQELLAILRRALPSALPTDLPGEVLAELRVADQLPMPLVTHQAFRRGRAVFASMAPFGDALSALASHLNSSLTRPAVPNYGAEGALPGETDLENRLEACRLEIEQLRSSIEELVDWRRLIGAASDQAFAQETLRALRLVAPAWQADEEHTDVGREDLLLNGPLGRMLVEAKSKNTGVRGEYVAQSEAHRLRLVEDARAAAVELPDLHTLLVVNQMRMSEILAARRAPVSAEIAAMARTRRVLVLRSWDLFNLVRHALRGTPMEPADFDRVLQAGGWLHVEGDETELYPPVEATS